MKAALEAAVEVVPDFRGNIMSTDMFTPTTIYRYTGHLNGAVYGSPQKIRDGRTHLEYLFICGTDRGFLGIVGALLSGIEVVFGEGWVRLRVTLHIPVPQGCVCTQVRRWRQLGSRVLHAQRVKDIFLDVLLVGQP